MEADAIMETLQGVDPVVWIVVAVAVVALLALAVGLGVRRRRQRRALRERYGPAYDRAARRAGSKRGADEELLEREERRQRYEVRDLDPSERERLRARWEALQAGFVDGPETTLRSAEDLLVETAMAKGYPTEDGEALHDVGVDHPLLVDRYRDALPEQHGDDERPPTTEQLRRGMLAARDLFEAMVGREQSETGEGGEAPFLDLAAEEERADAEQAREGSTSAPDSPAGAGEPETDQPLYGPDGRRLDTEAGQRPR